MPPRPKPILARIANKIKNPAGMTEDSLVSELASWAGPAYDKPHWIWGGHTHLTGVSTIWNDTQPDQVCRVIFTAIYGRPLLPSWRITRTCEEPRCVSPFHRQPQAVRGPDGYVEKLPDHNRAESSETVDDLVKLFRAGWDFEKLINQGKDFNMVVDANIIYDAETQGA